MKWFITAQSFALMASSITFPFYLLFIKNIGSTFSSFGFAYGLFTLSSAIFHRWIGAGADRFGSNVFLVAYAWGMALLFLLIPGITTLPEVYVMQIVLGLLGAVQKTCEKSMVAEISEGQTRGKIIGNYHFWTTLFSAIAVMGTGVLIDFFTIHFIFYIGSVLFAVSGALFILFDSNRIK
ncbi:MFS family permease [Bacillus pakistanensis]|uniref:MFS family permease n=1 Tax=Rossellomorea pakistanensis TaxID=992288 RepID=A0ABS2NGJ1_9BACI|nr:MFS transporter [Bacillus pakistanensis]MBM7586959.1 MFS family permease [Bacillus pakistanensis]